MLNFEDFNDFFDSINTYNKLTNGNFILKKIENDKKYTNYYLNIYGKNIKYKVLILKNLFSNVENHISLNILDDFIVFESISRVIPENKKFNEHIKMYVNNYNIHKPFYIDTIKSKSGSLFMHHIFSFYSFSEFLFFFKKHIVSKI